MKVALGPLFLPVGPPPVGGRTESALGSLLSLCCHAVKHRLYEPKTSTGHEGKAFGFAIGLRKTHPLASGAVVAAAASSDELARGLPAASRGHVR